MVENSDNGLDPALPSPHLVKQQAEWLKPARSRLLRRVSIARRKSILDLGAGYGAVTGELVRRSGGRVVALDRNYTALHEIPHGNGAFLVNGDARRLPFSSGTFDLIFCQCALLWMGHLETVVDEIWRLLKPSGVLVALEPDYPAMVEHPPDFATAAIWSASLERSGARPQVGRELPSLLANRGFEVRVDLIERLQPPSPARFQLLRELPLTKEEEAELAEIEERSVAMSEWELIVHLPFFLVTARRPGL